MKTPHSLLSIRTKAGEKASECFARFIQPRLFRVSLAEKIYFCERMGLYLRTGIPIVQGLSLIRKDAKSIYFITILETVQYDVSYGKSLARGLSTYPKQFDTFFCHFVTVGEKSGTLAKNLTHLGVLLKRKQRLRKKLFSALLYPALVALLALCVTAFLTLYAFPKIVPLFKGMSGELPFTTRALIGVTELISNHGGFIFLALIFSVVFFLYLLKNPRVKEKIDLLLITTPLVKKFVLNYYLANILRTLGTLLESGIPLVPAVALMNEGIKNSVFKKAHVHILEGITRGQKLSSEIEKHPSLFPLLVPQLLSAGEITGSLRESMSSLSEIYEVELDETTHTLTTLVEPVLMIVMGLIVGFVALAIISPIYGITQNFSVR